MPAATLPNQPIVNEPPERPRAYSYLRFSTPEQAKGDSLRRQTELAEAYAREHGLDLDKNLTYQDLGVSAYKGANVETGRLGEFRRAVEDGIVPTGSYLLVESLDRLSRLPPLDALNSLSSLCRLGIFVVTLTDRKTYSADSLQNDYMSLMMAVMVAIRANEESRTKARRVRAAWVAKFSRARKGEPTQRGGVTVITRKAPLWLKLTDDGWRPIDDRVAVVRRIFELAAAGTGKHRIAQTLNEEGVKPFRDLATGRQAAFWHRASIQNIVSNRAVVGTLEPYRTLSKKARAQKAAEAKSQDEQAAIEGYFPEIVDREIFEAVQSLGQVRAPQDRVAQLRGAAEGRGAVNYMLAGVARCASCGASAVRIWKGRRSKPRLVCSRAKIGAGCPYASVEIEVVEDALRRNLDMIVGEAPTGPEHLLQARNDLDHRVMALADEIDALVETLAQGYSPTIRAALLRKEEELEKTRTELEKAQAAVSSSSPASVMARLTDLRQAVLDQDPRGANVALRHLVSKVVVDFAEYRVSLHWRASDRQTDVFYKWPELTEADLKAAAELAAVS